MVGAICYRATAEKKRKRCHICLSSTRNLTPTYAFFNSPMDISPKSFQSSSFICTAQCFYVIKYFKLTTFETIEATVLLVARHSAAEVFIKFPFNLISFYCDCHSMDWFSIRNFKNNGWSSGALECETLIRKPSIILIKHRNNAEKMQTG